MFFQKFLHIFDVALSLPILCSDWTCIMKILSQFHQLGLSPPPVESITATKAVELVPYNTQSRCLLIISEALSFISVEFS